MGLARGVGMLACFVIAGGVIGYTIAYSQPDIVQRDVPIREEVCLGHEDPNGLLERAHRYQRAEAICGKGNVKKGVFMDECIDYSKVKLPAEKFDVQSI